MRTRIVTAMMTLCTAALAVKTQVDSQPTLRKPTLLIATLNREITVGGKQIKAWVPRMRFVLNGPVEGGSVFSVDFVLPGGKKVTADYGSAGPVDAGGTVDFKHMDYTSVGFPDDVGFTATGEVGFALRMSNPVSGAGKVTVYAGKFNVKSFKTSTSVSEFYVDQDWMLPLAYVHVSDRGLDGAGDLCTVDESATSRIYRMANCLMRMRVSLHFRGDGRDLDAFLLRDGKSVIQRNSTPEISPDSPACCRSDTELDISTGETSPYGWVQQTFGASLSCTHSGVIECMKEYAGTYELKVTHGGKPVRSVKFSIDGNGQFVASGAGVQALGADDIALFLPAAVIPEAGVKTDGAAWRSAFYGNPVAGFAAP